MGTLFITEYNSIGVQNGIGIQVPDEPAVADQTVTTSGTSAQSSAFNTSTRFVMLSSTVAVHLKFGDSPTATTSMQKIAAETEVYRAVKPGQKLAVIDAA